MDLDIAQLCFVHGGADTGACTAARDRLQQVRTLTERSAALVKAAHIDPEGSSVGANRYRYNLDRQSYWSAVVDANCPKSASQ
jgi:hypothetical protein